jgi:hypothetical protein
MALAEGRRFPLLPQALIARGALEAAGLHPFLFDEFRSSVLWTEQFAIGGVRIMVPEHELEPARALLLDIDDQAAETAAPTPAANQPGLLLVLFILSVVVGWPIAGFRQHDRFHQLTAFAVSAVVILVLLLSWVGAHRALS